MPTYRRNFLRQAAAAGMLTISRTALGEPLDIFQAAAAGDLPRVTELVNAEPELVRKRSADGRTALHYATAAGKPEMVMFLQGRGAELSAGPESPLLAAVDCPDAEAAATMTRNLAANASDPNARRQDGKSALQLAAARGYGEVAEFLIHRGARVTQADIAAATGNAVPILRGAAKVERVHFDRRYIQDVQGKAVVRDDSAGLPWTLVNQFVTIAHRDFDKVKEMMTAEPKLLQTRATWDETAIEAAAHMGSVPMAEWLAERGAAVSTCTAVILGQQEMVKRALAADRLAIYERGAHDTAILGFAAFGKEQAAIADVLLAAGANPSATALGLTPLHQAANKGYAELGTVLIERGADVNLAVRTRDGMTTPLGLAVKAKQTRMENLLRQHGGRV